ncbi:MAG: hypothetical protein KAQ62_01070 [Cyclobacteriaceae bacterium]|nr:hypothetical protein [Cyclobacteriaceae bacterium]MCK5469900.1 hypothetical protein [Cyclobacteriaceae bacterium]
MSNSFNKHINRIIFSLALISMYFMHTLGFAQDNAEKHRTYINIDFTQSETYKKLQAILTARIKGERGRKKIADTEIKFYNVSDTSEIFLGKATTDMNGIAVLEISRDQKLLVNIDGEFKYRANFKGNNDFQDVSKDMSIKAVNMKISFVEIDSIKNIVASAYQIDSSGDEISVEEDVIFYVPRQFSMLKIGEVELQDGEGSIEFPVTLPGDSIGNLQIIAIIEESRDYGNVEAIGLKDWGKPRPPVIIEARRGLGDTDAPLWMVYTLIVLLSAVWFHYMYILYVFLVIKRKGKNPDLA